MTNFDKARKPGASREREESFAIILARSLIDRTAMWAHCENRACRRARCCRDAHACQEKYGEITRDWFHSVMLPDLRERYPTVRWGSPEMSEQYQAALAAEKEEEARRQGRPVTHTRSCDGNKPEKPQLYDPGDL